MASNMCVWERMRIAVKQTIPIIQQWLRFPGSGQLIPALAGLPAGYQRAPDRDTRTIEEILSDPFMRKKATTDSRWSKERVKTRRLGHTHVQHWGTLKKNIITCLECGHYHERHSICGNCYDKVRQETAEMKKALGDGLRYTEAQTEVEFVYKGESTDRPKHEGKYIVEMDKPRPQWFADYLLKRELKKKKKYED